MTNAAAISGVLIDAGGTLWPDVWPELETDDRDRSLRLVSVLPSLTAASGLELVRLLQGQAAALDGLVTQDMDALVRGVLLQLDLGVSDWELAAIRRAMCLSASGRVDLFPRTRELLATIRALGLRCAIVSNSAWRDGGTLRRDLDDLGVAHYIDAFITSVDTGIRKPHPAMFETALTAIGCPPEQAVMIGDSERNDIMPALALRMRAIRVAIEQPRPSRSAAHAITGSLHEVAGLLRAWAWADET